MAKKVILKDLNDIEVLPITRGELVLDASGNPALHSTLFLATDSLPGLMSSEDKYKLDHLEESGPGANNKVAQINTTTNDVYRLLFSETADDTDRTEKSRKSAKLLFNPSTGVLTASLFDGKLEWSNLNNVPDSFTPAQHTHTTNEIVGLLGYTKAESPEDLVTTDTLNVALGKLEYKADTVYTWYRSITDEDTDDIINKWGEIVDFIDSVAEGTDITDEFVTRKTGQTITGVKTFSTLLKFIVALGTSPFTVTSTTKVDNLNADLLDGNEGSWYIRNVLNFQEVKGTNNAGGYDLNALNYGLVKNYSSPSYWANAPSNFSYGMVLNLKVSSTNDLMGQLAWDVNHHGTDSTKGLYWRAKDDTELANAKWHQIAFTDSNVASASQVMINYSYNQDVNYPLVFTSRDNIGAAKNGNLYIDFSGRPTYNPKSNTLTVGNINMTGSINSVLKATTSLGAAMLNIAEVTADINYIHLYVSSLNSTYATTRPLVLQNGYGNVGIGTLLPAYKLDVVGSIQSSDTVYGKAVTVVGDSTTPYLPNINWFDLTKNVGFHVSYRLKETVKPLRFYYKNGDTFTLLVDITSSGSVGIGTTAPIHKLQVAGAGVFNNTGSTTYATNGITIGAGDHAARYITCYGKTGSSFINVGYGPGANNSAEFAFNYTSDGSTSNYTMVSMYGAANAIYVYPGYTLSKKNISAPNYISTAATGALPYACTSTTLNTNLNADLLDGYHEGSFLRYRDYTTTSGASTLWNQIGIRSYYNALPEGLSGLYNYGQVVSLPGSSSRLDIFTNHVGSSESGGLGGLWWRSGWNDEKGPWRRIIDSGNIASLSVNYATSAGNADSVDGQHFNWNNNKNDHTYLWAASSNGQAYLVHRASMSVNYASSAGNADTVDNKHASYFHRNHRTDITNLTAAITSDTVTFDVSSPTGGPGGWVNCFASIHSNYLSSFIANEHRTNNWWVGWVDTNNSSPKVTWKKLAFTDLIPTNTWRPVTNTYTGSDQSTCVSQYGTNALYNALVNGYASSAGNADTVDSCHKDDFLRRTDTLGYLGKFVLENIPKGVTQVGSIGWTDYQNYPYAGGLWMTLRGTSSLSTALILFPSYSMSSPPILYSSVDGGAWQGGYQLAYKSQIPTTMAWGSITGKPSTFTPSSHTHSYITPYGEGSVANTRTANYDTAVCSGGWASASAGYGSTYGTTLDVSGYSTWYHRLAFRTDGRIEYWQGINTKTMTRYGTLAWTSDIPSVGNGTVTIKQAGVSKGSFTMNQSGNTTIELTDNNTTYSLATSSTLGLVKIGYSTSNKNYAVQLDSSGKMYVNVPWTDTNTTYTLSSLGIGNVKNYDQSKAIKSITRSGTTFTYTCLDGTTGTFTQLDNNTTYSFAATGSATKGIYLSGTNTFKAMTYSLKATVNSGTANKLAYYSEANAISAYTSTRGDYYKPIYLSGGVPIECYSRSIGSVTWGTNCSGYIQVKLFGPIVILQGYFTKIDVNQTSSTNYVFKLPTGTPSPATTVGITLSLDDGYENDRNTIIMISGQYGYCNTGYNSFNPNGLTYYFSACYMA